MSATKCPTCGTGIEEHEAGRCLDAWVESAIFARPNCEAWIIQSVSIQGPVFIKTGKCEHESCLPVGMVAEFSSNISAAWQVVEKAKFRWTVWRDDDGWTAARYYPEGSKSWRVLSTSTTAPLAICRAAILATVKP